MKKSFIVLLPLFALFAGCCCTPSDEGARSLFNGRDLAGWVAMHGGGWTVEDGAIVGRNGTNWTTNPEKSGSWLRTEKEYSDFVLEFEYAINAGGNSGVFIRSGLEKNPSFTGHEMQILDDGVHEDGKKPKTRAGTLYDIVACNADVSRPAGEWNKARAVVKGTHIRHDLNGFTVVDIDTASPDFKAAFAKIASRRRDDGLPADQYPGVALNRSPQIVGGFQGGVTDGDQHITGAQTRLCRCGILGCEESG